MTMLERRSIHGIPSELGGQATHPPILRETMGLAPGITCFSCFNKASLALTPSSFLSFFRELANLSLVFCTRLGFAGKGFLVAAS